MIVCAAGDIHGALDRLFEDVLASEEVLGVRFEWVLDVGDFGQIDSVRCIGLNKVRMPGNLVAIDVPECGREWTVLGEWPERRA